MESLPKEKSYCPTCGHVVAKERTNLSSLEFRRFVHKIDTLEELIDNKDRLYRFIKSSYNKDLADQFLEDLENKVTNDNLENIKLWLLGFVNNKDHGNPKEIALYKFLLETFSSIDTSFSEFYDIYCHDINDPMTKNRVSRALSAFGLKSVMKKITYGGKKKCTMFISATEEEMAKLREKNGFSNYHLIP